MHKVLILIVFVLNICFGEEISKDYLPIVTEESRNYSMSQVGKTKEMVRKEHGNPGLIDQDQWVYLDPLKLGPNSFITRKRYLFKNNVVIGVVSEQKGVGCIYTEPIGK